MGTGDPMRCKRILILRPDNIGDVVLFSGALQHIRNLFPDAHITLAVLPHIFNLVELCPFIDVCVSVNELTWWGKIEHNKFPFKYRLEEAIHSINKLWNIIGRPYDIIICPIKSPEVNYLEIIYCLNAKQMFGITGCILNTKGKGYPSKFKPDALFTNCLDVSIIDPWTHELFVTSDFLRFLGCRITTIDDIKPQFWLSNTENNYINRVQRNARKIIGLFPGASYEEKCWEAGNYGELAKLLGGRICYVIFGSLADKDLTDRVGLSIRAHCENAEIINLAGHTTLRELVKTIHSCDLFIGMDTSGLHIAIAANVPTIGIVGGGHFGRFVPWGDSTRNIFLTKKMECFHCNWACSKNEVECIKGVSPRDVASTAKKLLKLYGDNNGMVTCQKECVNVL